jgi:hypothetical protein
MICEWWIAKDVKESDRGLILMYYPGICLERLRKNTEILSQVDQSIGRGLNQEPSEYEEGVYISMILKTS